MLETNNLGGLVIPAEAKVQDAGILLKRLENDCEKRLFSARESRKDLFARISRCSSV